MVFIKSHLLKPSVVKELENWVKLNLGNWKMEIREV